MFEDIKWRFKHQRKLTSANSIELEVQSYTVLGVEVFLNRNNRSLKEYWSISYTKNLSDNHIENALISEESGYDCDVLKEEVNTLLPLLNKEQRKIFNVVRHTVRKEGGGFFFVYESRGTGKTFMWKTIFSSL